MHSQSVPSWVKELARNNQKPSEEEAQEVKRLLVIPLQDLQNIKSEISDLKTPLSELQSKHDETEKQISRLNSILAPIRRVPTDVLGEIFYQCLPTYRNPIIKSTDCPLLLTHVCSPWRAVAMSSPRLWERLHITFTDDDSVPDLATAAEMAQKREIPSPGWQDALSKPEKEHIIVVLRRRYDAVKEWLLRSGTRPLSLSILFTSRYWYPVPLAERAEGSVTMELLSFLATLAPRFKALELNAQYQIYEALEKMVKVSEMTTLTSLGVRHQRQLQPIEARHPQVQSFFQAPELRQLSILANNPDISGEGIHTIPCQWFKLTSLSCYDSLSINDTIFLLEHASNLIRYKGTISEYIIDQDQPFFYDGHISLPFLQTLNIGEFVKPHRVRSLYDSIDAPVLHTVEYFSFFYLTRAGEFSAFNPAPIPIFQLLCKATNLRNLRVNAKDLTLWDLGPLLRVVPNITHLVIGVTDGRDRENPCGHAALGPYPSFVPPDYEVVGVASNDVMWSFDKLVVVSDSNENDDMPPLVPHLTSLTISSLTAKINESIVFNIVKSRMCSSVVAPLEHVKIKFYKKKRPISREIVEELYNYAESLGVNAPGKKRIDLDVQYSPISISEENGLSPEFGLVEPDGRKTRLYLGAGEN